MIKDPGKIAIIALIIAIYILCGNATANSIQFTGLQQVNKTIDVYDLTDIADGGDQAPVTTINNSDKFYYTPGHTYNFQIKSQNTTTFLSGPMEFANFFIGDETRLLAIGTFLILCIFTVLLVGGAAILILWFKVI